MIVNISDIKECSDFFSDLCTYKELEEMTQGIVVARMLHEGNTYNQVIAVTIYRQRH